MIRPLDVARIAKSALAVEQVRAHVFEYGCAHGFSGARQRTGRLEGVLLGFGHCRPTNRPEALHAA